MIEKMLRKPRVRSCFECSEEAKTKRLRIIDLKRHHIPSGWTFYNKKSWKNDN